MVELCDLEEMKCVMELTDYLNHQKPNIICNKARCLLLLDRCEELVATLLSSNYDFTLIKKVVNQLHEIIVKCKEFIDNHGKSFWESNLQEAVTDDHVQHKFHILNDVLFKIRQDIYYNHYKKKKHEDSFATLRKWLMADEKAETEDIMSLLNYILHIAEINNINITILPHIKQDDRNLSKSQILIYLQCLYNFLKDEYPNQLVASQKLLYLLHTNCSDCPVDDEITKEESQITDSDKVDQAVSSNYEVSPSDDSTPLDSPINSRRRTQTTDFTPVNVTVTRMKSGVSDVSALSTTVSSDWLSASCMTDVDREKMTSIKSLSRHHSYLSEWNPAKASILGQGQFSSIYLYTRDNEKKHSDPVVVRVFANMNKLTNDDLNNLKRDVNTSLLINHINLIHYMDIDISRGIIITEFALYNLDHIIYKSGTVHIRPFQLTFKMKLRWLYEILCGLRYLHFHSVLHKNLKPSNVLLIFNKELNMYVAKLTDFGINNSLSSILTTRCTASVAINHSINGTVSYMAPELFHEELSPQEMYTAAIDIYAYGILANEVFVEKRPYYGCSVIQIIKMVVLSNKRPDLYIKTLHELDTAHKEAFKSVANPSVFEYPDKKHMFGGISHNNVNNNTNRDSGSESSSDNMSHDDLKQLLNMNKSEKELEISLLFLCHDVIGNDHKGCLHQTRISRPTADFIYDFFVEKIFHIATTNTTTKTEIIVDNTNNKSNQYFESFLNCLSSSAKVDLGSNIRFSRESIASAITDSQYTFSDNNSNDSTDRESGSVDAYGNVIQYTELRGSNGSGGSGDNQIIIDSIRPAKVGKNDLVTKSQLRLLKVLKEDEDIKG